MRPYLAIIKDSIRAALATRVLYVLLSVITTLLLAVAPLHLRETLDWKLQFESHFRNPKLIVKQLALRKDSPDHPGAKRIWSQLTSKMQASVLELADGKNKDKKSSKDNGKKKRRQRDQDGNPFRYMSLINELNKLMDDPSFYRERDWDTDSLTSETQELIKEGPSTLSVDKTRRLNRLLISNALPAIAPAEASSIKVMYGGWELTSFSETLAQSQSTISEQAAIIFDKFVLSLGLMIGIVVTSNLIPETFNPGSLNLLLSKPIGRAGLYLTKFAGGCVLIAVCTTYLFTGVWLWMGLAIGNWDIAFLWSIPLYIIVFAIYFSVSAFIGLNFRSSTMAVVVTGMFWGICWGVGMGYSLMNNWMQNNRLYHPIVVNDQPLALDGTGNLVHWHDGISAWEPTKLAKVASNGPPAMVTGFVSTVAKLKERSFLLPPLVGEKGRIFVGTNNVFSPDLRNQQPFYFTKNEKSPFQKVGTFPADTVRMFSSPEGLILVDSSGDFSQIKPNELTAERIAAANKVMEGDEEFEPFSVDNIAVPIGPENRVRVGRAFNVDFNRSNQEIAIYRYSRRKHMVYVFKRVGDQYQQNRSLQVDIGSESRINCYLTYQGNTIVLVAGNGQIITIDATKMEEQQGFQPESRFGIEEVSASPDGRWIALVYRNQKLWLLDTENQNQLNRPNVRGQGNISSAAFNAKNELCVVDRTDRLTCYDTSDLSVKETYSAMGSVVKNIFRLGIKPLYRVFPKPSEFYKVVRHLSSTNDGSENADVDLTTKISAADPYGPLWSGLAFMFVMLTLACGIFHFKDL